MTTASPSPAAPEAQFSVSGTIATWDPFGRWLSIGEHQFWLAPGVSGTSLVPGAKVTASGHHDELTARWIVTILTLD